MKKQTAFLLCLALMLPLFVTGCARSTKRELPAASDGSGKLTQKGTVRKTGFEKSGGRYPKFLTAANPCFVIPGLAQGLTPQGLTYSPERDLVYLSSYAAEGVSSVICTVRLKTGRLQAEYALLNADKTPFTAHVGGITVTKSCLYFSAEEDSDGMQRIACLPLEVLEAEGRHEVVVDRLIDVPVPPSFLSCSEDVLWVGNFYHPKGGYGLPPAMEQPVQGADGGQGSYIFAYDVAKTGGRLTMEPGERYPAPVYVLSVPDKIQGAVCAGDKAYLSQSYGRKNDSVLLSFAFSPSEPCDAELRLFGRSLPLYMLDSRRQTGLVKAMPMAEGLALTGEGKVLVLFESGALRYADGRDRTDRVWEWTP